MMGDHQQDAGAAQHVNAGATWEDGAGHAGFQDEAESMRSCGNVETSDRVEVGQR